MVVVPLHGREIVDARSVALDMDCVCDSSASDMALVMVFLPGHED
jgi:hypothetical protein